VRLFVGRHEQKEGGHWDEGTAKDHSGVGGALDRAHEKKGCSIKEHLRFGEILRSMKVWAYPKGYRDTKKQQGDEEREG